MSDIGTRKLIDDIDKISKFSEGIQQKILESATEINAKMDAVIKEALDKHNLVFTQENKDKFSKTIFSGITTIFYEEIPLVSYTDVNFKKNDEGEFEVIFNYHIYEPEKVNDGGEKKRKKTKTKASD